ncbi:MAG: DUF4846 domain-containing protein [Deltaproteobacteria bacterium]|jgi:hypothetical protein|nr:DUF4846 domain-containing protein [Deltaproteobacteria bacterium]
MKNYFLCTIILLAGCSNKSSIDKTSSEGNSIHKSSNPGKVHNKLKPNNALPKNKNSTLLDNKQNTKTDLEKENKPVLAAPGKKQADSIYSWRNKGTKYISLAKTIPTPAGYLRKKVKKQSYAWYLRHLPLKPAGSPVKTYKGKIVSSWQSFARAVIDLPLDTRGFMQCIDVIVKLRAEYLWWRNQKSKIGYLCGTNKYFTRKQCSKGIRYLKKNNNWQFMKTTSMNSSRHNFNKYLNWIFAMTGTINHVSEQSISFKNLRAGDFLVTPPPKPGSLGHAILIVDLASDKKGNLIALFAQGFTPAQSMHIIKNNHNSWFAIKGSQPVKTPLWKDFHWSDLKRFKY